MIYLLGGSGYVGHAYQALLTRKGIPFRNLRRADIDYTVPEILTAALKADRLKLEREQQETTPSEQRPVSS